MKPFRPDRDGGARPPGGLHASAASPNLPGGQVPPKRSANHKRWTAVAVILALVLLLWWWLRPKTQPPAPAAVRAEAAPRAPDSPPQASPVSEPMPPASPPASDPSEAAYYTLQDALRKMLTARTYRSTMRFLNRDGSISSQMVMEYWRDELNQEHFRSEELYYDDRTRQLRPGSTRITIVNPDGAWVMKPDDGLPDVAFRIQNDPDPGGSSTLHRSLLNLTTQKYASGINYSATSVIRSGRPATMITSTVPSSGMMMDHIIDGQTGDLLEMGTHVQPGWSVRYEVDIALSPDRFSIPKDSVVVPTDNLARDAIDISKLLKKQPTQSP